MSNNYEILLGIGMLILTAISVWLHKRRAEIENRYHKLEGKLEKLREYGRNTEVIEYIYQDIVLLGPRKSGKTSIAELWSKPWCDITLIERSEYWKTYSVDICEIKKDERDDELFDVKRTYHTMLRVRIYDYPGEDRFRTMAIENLPNSKNAVLLLLFDIEANSNGIIQIHKNNEYYSKVFMETIEKQKNLSQHISKVIIVFNKIDLLPPTWDYKKMEDEIKSVNSDADTRIRSLFSGKLQYFLVSALDNRKLISLLGACASSGLPKYAKEKFEEEIRKLEMDIT